MQVKLYDNKYNLIIIDGYGQETGFKKTLTQTPQAEQNLVKKGKVGRRGANK